MDLLKDQYFKADYLKKLAKVTQKQAPTLGGAEFLKVVKQFGVSGLGQIFSSTFNSHSI